MEYSSNSHSYGFLRESSIRNASLQTSFLRGSAKVSSCNAVVMFTKWDWNQMNAFDNESVVNHINLEILHEFRLKRVKKQV